MFNDKSLLYAPLQPLSDLTPEHYYKSSEYTFTDGLISQINDTGLSGGLNATSSVAAERPAYGYDRAGQYIAKLANFTLVGSKVSVWTNTADATTRSWGNISQGTDANRPTWNSGNNSVDFDNGQSLTITRASSYTTSSLSVHRSFTLPTVSDSITLNALLVLGGVLNTAGWRITR
jgi:hypothetical protein